tara:strand:+ start:8981 stop:9163 length:183 start_codon:yes stop_codon:yes gene_type:complete
MEKDDRTLILKQIDAALKEREGIHNKNYGYHRDNPKQGRPKKECQKTLIKKEGKFIIQFH